MLISKNFLVFHWWKFDCIFFSTNENRIFSLQILTVFAKSANFRVDSFVERHLPARRELKNRFLATIQYALLLSWICNTNWNGSHRRLHNSPYHTNVLSLFSFSASSAEINFLLPFSRLPITFVFRFKTFVYMRTVALAKLSNLDDTHASILKNFLRLSQIASAEVMHHSQLLSEVFAVYFSHSSHSTYTNPDPKINFIILRALVAFHAVI